MEDGANRMGRGMNMDMDNGMMMDYDHEDHDDHHHDHMEEQKAVKQDPWAGYYDFLINEGSFKFWAVFQVQITFSCIIQTNSCKLYFTVGDGCSSYIFSFCCCILCKIQCNNS